MDTNYYVYGRRYSGEKWRLLTPIPCLSKDTAQDWIRACKKMKDKDNYSEFKIEEVYI
jgi:hypothetical protein